MKNGTPYKLALAQINRDVIQLKHETEQYIKDHLFADCLQPEFTRLADKLDTYHFIFQHEPGAATLKHIDWKLLAIRTMSDKNLIKTKLDDLKAFIKGYLR